MVWLVVVFFKTPAIVKRILFCSSYLHNRNYHARFMFPAPPPPKTCVKIKLKKRNKKILFINYLPSIDGQISLCCTKIGNADMKAIYTLLMRKFISCVKTLLARLLPLTLFSYENLCLCLRSIIFHHPTWGI